MSSKLDPEDLCQIIKDYQTAVDDVVANTGGYIARYIGDGILVYFGYPNSREDDAERAVRCGLQVTARVRALGANPSEFSVRVGIATGEVVVGDVIGSGTSQQVIALGEAPNIGARLQAKAKPGTVLIEERTRQLTGGLFEYEKIGKLMLRGLSRPVHAFAVKSERAGISRFAALRPRRAALVGRQEELELLAARWRSAQAGDSRLVLISGEPGIGKSRLVAAFVEKFAAASPTLHLACSPNGTGSPLLPVRQAIERMARLQASDTGHEIRRKLDDMLVGLALSSDYATAIRRLLHGVGREDDELPETTPRRLKETTFDAIDAYVSTTTRGGAAVIVIEDLHWVDPTTGEWLARRVSRAGAGPTLTLVTTRRESLPDWATNPLVANIVLNRLHHRQAAKLIRQIIQGLPVTSETVTEIIGRSDGLPLFIEELTQSVMDHVSPVGSSAVLQAKQPISGVPSSLESLLASRLDQAGRARDVAQIASVIGREFHFHLLKAVAEQETAPLLQYLSELAEHGLITQHGEGEDSLYAFRHVLIQEAAYRTLMGPRRRQLHLKIAAVLDRQDGLGTTTEPEQVALHYGWAGQHEKATQLYRKAALRARGRYALVERAQHLQQAVLHARSLPDEVARSALELEVLIELGLAQIDHRGSGYDDVRATFERARDLCLELENHTRLVVVLDALALNYHFARSESAQMLQYAAELDDVAVRGALPLAALWAARMRSSARLLRGEFEPARIEFETVVARYKEMESETAGTRTARDPRSSTYGNLAICLTAQGRVTDAMAALHDGMRHARESKSMPSIMASLRRACLQGMIVRDNARVLAQASQLIAFNTEHETFTGLREGTIAQGWATIHIAGSLEVLGGMLISLDELQQAQHFVHLPFLLSAVAEQAWLIGDRNTALALLQRASSLLDRTGEVWCHAELVRLEAQFCEGNERATVTLLQRSLRIARDQGAAWWELRAAADLAEIWTRAGAVSKARALLQATMPRFAHSPGLPDTMRAQALLSGLTKPRGKSATATTLK